MESRLSPPWQGIAVESTEPFSFPMAVLSRAEQTKTYAFGMKGQVPR